MLMFHIFKSLLGMSVSDFPILPADSRIVGRMSFISVGEYISKTKWMFIPTDPFMALNISTFLQFTESIQASNGAASESQVVGQN